MQKPFAFLLLPFCFIISACWFNPNLQGTGQPYLQGEWKQDSVIKQEQLLNYSLYNFKFSCDSFFVKIRTYSKINTGVDSCMNSGQWTEYIKGSYSQSHDTLRLNGLFSNSDYRLKNDGCFRIGVYEEYFKVIKKTDSLIQLSSMSNEIPINLHLTHKIICNPKPL